ncbi:MAG: sugar ABC transporter substrate-binding protein [Rubellimicrobium sp.]|nr:sugar ABC transporter substrate-binding protein [Rubellimicrobium sp.]
MTRLRSTKPGRRVFIAASTSALAFLAAMPAMSQTLECPAAARMEITGDVPPANMRIGVSVAYLEVPFYANFKLGLEDGAAQFGFTYDLVSGNMGDVATELANLQNFAAQRFDLVLLTPSGEGILPGIVQLIGEGVPVIEVNNRAGFGRDGVDVVTYVGANDVDFGRLHVQMIVDNFGDDPVRVAYVMGPLSSPAQVLRAEGWDEARAAHPNIEEVARVVSDFDSAKALAVVQDVLSRFPEGSLDAIVMQGPEGGAAVEYAIQNGREEVRFFVGDYPADIRQMIADGKITATVNQDPYPQAYHAMEMAYLHLMGQDAEIPKPYFLPLPVITQENAAAVAPAWGCP